MVQDTECGKWFYNEMDEMLETMFDIFAKIYAIYYGSGNGVKSLLGLKKTVNKYEIELASRCYDDIVNISDKFKNRFGVLERQLYALSDEKHELIMIS